MNGKALSLTLGLLASVTVLRCSSSQRSQDSQPQEDSQAQRDASQQQDPQRQGASVEQDSARVARLEREARAIASSGGCSSVDQCRSAPVGERPCGGPRDYIVYCARTTDSAGLYRKLAELRQAEIALNKKSGAMSTCEFRTPPHLAMVGGSCRSR